ncbi:hypothetical protein EU527_07025 [Candidatus Thorarchaeota archaeon]|nr:MAG: hypothetical protein EU527_07025 [Candidatus Thorarchaeota archaeon]
MNALLFLLISLIAHSIPIPFSPKFTRPNMLIKWLPLRLVWGTIAWVVICLLFVAALPWAILGLIMSLGAIMMFTSGFRPGGDIEEMLHGIRVPFACFGFIILITVPMFSGVISWTAGVSNAQYFDSMITETDDPLFTNPIPDHMVRLVTEEYAKYVAKQHISPFGSNAIVAAAHITLRNGTLVWVCTIVSTNVLAQNFIKGFIVVDANDPQSEEPEIITATTIPVGEGLFWDKNIQFGNYLNDMTSLYEYAYPTWTPSGDMVYVQTRTPLGFDFVERAIGPVVYAENGTVFHYDSIEVTPDWITQAYSEEWLERQITRWGSYRRGLGFDLFSGGLLWFIPPSSDRLEIHEDTRYLLNPDSGRIEAFITVHPVTARTTLAGVFRATPTEVFYHDLSTRGYISGDAAAANVLADIGQVASGFYYAAMPLLYPVVISPTVTKWTWYTPIYWADAYYDDDLGEYIANNMRLHALGLVDASNVDRFVWRPLSGSLSGGALVNAVRTDYIELLGGTVEEESTGVFNITATVNAKASYTKDGQEHIVLRTDNATYEFIEGAANWMNSTDWYTLVFLGVGDSFTATVLIVGEVYRIITIVKN